VTAVFLTYSGISSEVAPLGSDLTLDLLRRRYETLMNSEFQRVVATPLGIKMRAPPLAVTAFAPGGTPWTAGTLGEQLDRGRRVVLYTAAFLDDFSSAVPCRRTLRRR
jgi:hypothetical protein